MAEELAQPNAVRAGQVIDVHEMVQLVHCSSAAGARMRNSSSSDEAGRVIVPVWPHLVSRSSLRSLQPRRCSNTKASLTEMWGRSDGPWVGTFGSSDGRLGPAYVRRIHSRAGQAGAGGLRPASRPPSACLSDPCAGDDAIRDLARSDVDGSASGADEPSVRPSGAIGEIVSGAHNTPSSVSPRLYEGHAGAASSALCEDVGRHRGDEQTRDPQVEAISVSNESGASRPSTCSSSDPSLSPEGLSQVAAL